MNNTKFNQPTINANRKLHSALMFAGSSFLSDSYSVMISARNDYFAEGFVNGEYFVSFATSRGVLTLVKQEEELWTFVCDPTFWQVTPEYYVEPDLDFSKSPAQCMSEFGVAMHNLNTWDKGDRLLRLEALRTLTCHFISQCELEKCNDFNAKTGA